MSSKMLSESCQNKEFIFHIGIPKTATSFFQFDVFPRFEGLTYINHRNIREYDEFNHLQFADDSFYRPQTVRKRLDSFDGPKILLSEERFSGRFIGFGGFINRSIIAKRIKELVPNARILIFLRGQRTFVYSAYQQYIKGYSAGTKPFSEFILEPGRYTSENFSAPVYDGISMGFSLHYIYYFELLSLYKSLFKDVKVLLFEDFKTNPTQFLTELEMFIQPTNTLAGKIDFSKKLNDAVTPERLLSIRYANSMKYLGNSFMSNFFRRFLFLTNIQARKTAQLEKQEAEKLMSAFHENNRSVIEFFPEVGIQRYSHDYPTE